MLKKTLIFGLLAAATVATPLWAEREPHKTDKESVAQRQAAGKAKAKARQEARDLAYASSPQRAEGDARQRLALQGDAEREAKRKALEASRKK